MMLYDHVQLTGKCVLQIRLWTIGYRYTLEFKSLVRIEIGIKSTYQRIVQITGFLWVYLRLVSRQKMSLSIVSRYRNKSIYTIGIPHTKIPYFPKFQTFK